MPDGWKEQFLSELCERITDGSHFSPPSLDEGIPIATVANMGSRSIELNRCALISEKDFALLERNGCRPRAGDVLFSKDGSVGKVLVMQDSPRLVLLSSIAILTPKCNELESFFLGQYLKWPRVLRRLHGMRTGTAIKRVVLRDLRKLPLSVPPVSEQRKIAAILSSVDDAIARTQAVIDQVQVVKRGLMQELLTRGLPGRHTRYKQTEIGSIPMEWEVVRLGDIAAVRGGKRMPKGRPFADSVTPYPYIRVCDFKNGSVDTSQIEYVLPEDREKIRRYTISQDDLYISIAGTLGIVGTVPPSLDGAQLTENAAKIVLEDRGQANRDFLKIAMNAKESQAQLERLRGVGGGVPKLALFRIEEILLPLPCIREQRDIVGAVHRMDEYHLTLEAKLDAAKEVRRGLMAVLLTGELRVTPDIETA